MLDRTQVSLICPRNDLESATILDIAQRLELHSLEIQGSWGLTLADALTQFPDIDALRPEVIVIELPGEAAADYIRSRGKRLHQIDHHLSTAGGKAASLSSLEQFAALVGHTLTRKEQEIVIADRDFFPGLSRAGVPWERAVELRREEYAISTRRLKRRHTQRRRSTMSRCLCQPQKDLPKTGNLFLVPLSDRLSGANNIPPLPRIVSQRLAEL